MTATQGAMLMFSHAANERNFQITCEHVIKRRNHDLKSRTTKTIDSQSWDVFGNSKFQSDVAWSVSALRSRMQNVSEEDMLNFLWLYLCLFYCCFCCHPA